MEPGRSYLYLTFFSSFFPIPIAMPLTCLLVDTEYQSDTSV